MSATTKEIVLKLKMISDMADVTGNISQIQQVLNKLNVPRELKQNFVGIFSELERETKNYQNLLNSGFKNKKDVTGLEASGKRINGLMKSLSANIKKIDTSSLEQSFKIDPAEFEKLNKELTAAQEKLASIKSSEAFKGIISGAENAAKSVSKITKTKAIGEFLNSLKDGNIEGASKALEQLRANIDKFKENSENKALFSKAVDDFANALDALKGNTTLQETTAKIEELQTKSGNLKASGLEAFFKIFEDGKFDIDKTIESLRDFFTANNQAAESQHNLNSEIESLKGRIGYFFSLTNAVQLFRNAVNKALETVKELDATMTEAAVVTDFSVGDMWEKLPIYAEQAQKLGVSINGMYQATTLYYQQGLKTNEAMALGVETMKMAKIAGIESTDATKAMTAALRGFNMELNETSAVRVNDVYSQLAAVTAADVSQISTAMEKTASIAASANMEFETTAALLSQIIETTQEAPETAGTAMKTIIARFSEVKSLREQGLVTGTDEEGEALDVNKIQSALRTVGISMEGFFSGTEGLDSILLKLAEKWKTLDFETQRYIATTAAGSRQQSRFIAMMSDYGRTMELVEQAQGSAGASQKQFGKTLESLDSKLQSLENAWDTFLMNLANDQIIKGFVDILTTLITSINKIIDLVSGGNGLQKSFLSLATAIGALSVGGNLFKGFEASIKDAATGSGKGFAQSFKEGFTKNFNKKSKWFDGFLPDKKQQTEMINKSFGDAFNGIDFNKLASGARENLKESLWKDFSDSMGETDLTGQVTKEEFVQLFDQGKELEAINKLNDAAGDLNKKLVVTEKTAKLATSRIEQGFSAAAIGAGAVASALGLLSNHLRDRGYEDAADGFEALAGGATVLAGILTILPGLFNTLGISIAALPIVGWIAGITTAVVALGIAISEWVETPAERMERLEKATEEAKEAAEGAKNAYNEMLSAKDGYTEMQKGLETLVKGTNEWKQALIESNQQVMQLIQTYPILASYLKKGGEGQWTITPEGWNALADQQQGQITTTQAISAGAKISEINNRRQGAIDTLNELFTQGNMLDVSVRDKVLEVWEKDPATFESAEKLEKLSEATGYSVSYLQEMPSALQAYSTTMNETQKELETYTEFFASGVSADALSSEYSSKILEGFGQGYSDKAADTIEAEAAALQTKDPETGKDGIQIKAEELRLEQTDNSIETYRAVYEEITGQVANESWSKSDLAQKIASAEQGEKYSDQVEDLIEKLDYMATTNKTGANQIAGLISGDVANLTRTDATNLTKNGGLMLEDLASYATSLGYANEFDMAKALGYTDENSEGDIVSLLAVWRELAYSIEDEFVAVNTKATNKGLDAKLLNQDYIQSATVGQYESYTTLLTQMLGAGGKPLAQSFSDNFSKIMETTTSDQEQKILEMLGSFDFTKEGDIASFFDYLQEIGVGLDTDVIQALTNDLTILSSAFAKIDLTEIINQTKELLDLSDQLKSRSDAEGLSQEEYDQVIASGAANKEDFVWTGQEWLYLEGTLKQLAETLETWTVLGVGDKVQDLRDQIDSGDGFRKVLSQIGNGDFGDLSIDKFLGGEGAGLTADTIREVLGLGEVTDAEAWHQYDTKKRNYENLTANQNMLSTYEDQIDSMVSMARVPMSLGVSNGLPEDLVDEQDQKTLVALAKQYGVTQTEIDKFTKAMESTDLETRKAAASTLKNITEQKKQEKQLEATIKTLNDVNNKYGTISKDMPGYTEAVNEFGEALGLDMTDSKNWEFVSENLELVRSAAEGNVESFQKLLYLLEQDYGFTIGINGEVSGFKDATEEAKKQASDLLALLEKLGYYEVVEQEITAGATYFKPIYENGNMVGVEPVTAEQTQVVQMIRPKDAASIQNSFDNSGITKTSSGGGSETKWENKYDEFYNSVKKINAELRIRERLEREYQRLLERNAATVENLLENRQKQLNSLDLERNQREALLENRKGQMSGIESEYSDMSRYAWYDEELGQVQMNWDLIEGLDGSTNEELTSRLEEYISKLEEQQELIEEQEDALQEINDAVWEIYQQGKDQYFDVENLVREAIIADRQKEIDKLSEINESINTTNSKIVESMQEQINEYRQNRQNEKTEQELSDKQRRLAYLQQDTSGANALEIMKLQEEIDQGQQDYTDSLIDQKISELQAQNDKAAEQRQEQIDLMQAQLDYYSQSALIWEDVNQLIEEGFDPETGIINGSKLEEILQEEANWEGMSKLSQMNWFNETNRNIAEALAWLKSGAMQTMFGEGKTITFTDKDGNTLTGVVDADGNVVTDQGVFSGSSFSMDAEGNLTSSQGVTPPQVEDTSTTKSKPEVTSNDKKGVSAAIWNGGYGWGTGSTRSARLKEVFGENDIQTNYVNKGVTSGYTGKLSEYSYENMKKKFKAYKTGGLADFTGPAWLDGTKSKPEYILNAEQTKAFFTLVDVLGGLQTRGLQSSQNTGDSNYDIDINVESIGSDYDVEQLAGKIKSLINEDARYRNNNAISLMR